MIYLGSSRVITNDFSTHKTAEDYAGNHQSDISIVGSGRVIKIVNRFTSHEDSINYNNYLNNKNIWKDGTYYNCISITGKNVRMHYEELGGNQVWIETYFENKKITLRFAHLDDVLVNVGDIIKPNQVFAHQGNTGLVLSSKNESDVTYGSHVHLEITDEQGNYLNPREFSTGNYVTSYLEQTNTRDESKKQIQIMVDKINIRESPSEFSTDLGDVYLNEIYTVLDEVDSEVYIWYKITTSLGLTGYVACKKDSNWINILEKKEEVTPVIPDNKEENPTITDDKDQYQLIFTCEKEDYYYLKLYPNEKLYIKK